MSRPPNVLWIITTQWRAQACGFAGNAEVRTPNLDALAARGMVYTQAVTPHPFGPFARAAMLTGVESPQNGVRDYFDPLPPASRTIAQDLSELGYATAFFGKWHLARRDPAAPLVGEEHARTIVPPESRGGFGFWEGFESGFQLHDPWLHGTRLAAPTRFPGYQSEVLSTRASDWCTEARGPWFCVVSVEAPHPPYGSAPAVDTPDPAGLTLPPNVPPGADVEAVARRELSGYYGHIAATDRALGRLLARIDFSTTAVVFTSVHGDMHGSHGLFRKGWPYEESVRVPLVIAAPGMPAGKRESAVSLVELPAWTRQLAAGDGLPDLAAAGARISMPSVVSLPHQCDRIWNGIRSKDRKLILLEDGSPWLFFHLDEDPFELVNLAKDSASGSEIAIWREFLAVLEKR